jgi:CubicO group peptidase (beta-lactamase class C family)
VGQRFRLLPCLFLLPLAGCVPTVPGHSAATADRPVVGAEVLFWSQAQRESGFPHMERLYRVHTVKHGAQIHPLPKGKSLAVSIELNGGAETVDQFMQQQGNAGILVLEAGHIRLEQYAMGYGPKGRWTSFSVAKSITSTLVGAAIRDGYINSVDDPITRYLPGLQGSAYDGVSIRQVLTMTSGVKWNEDYLDPGSDVAQLYTVAPDPGLDPTISYMRKLTREAAPGSQWVYKTGETNLIGVLVSTATRQTLSDYLSKKIWRAYGMERDAVWMIDARGQESGGCCLSASLHDYGRMGLFMLEGGIAAGAPVLPDGWIASATQKQADIGAPDRGYGFQWWTQNDGSFNALGIFGQAIHIDPTRKLVIVISSAWSVATDQAHQKAREALFAAVNHAIDAESGPLYGK